jgi:hypothetical protein
MSPWRNVQAALIIAYCADIRLSPMPEKCLDEFDRVLCAHWDIATALQRVHQHALQPSSTTQAQSGPLIEYMLLEAPGTYKPVDHVRKFVLKARHISMAILIQDYLNGLPARAPLTCQTVTEVKCCYIIIFTR